MMIQTYTENIGKQLPYDVVIPTDIKNAKFVGTVVKYIRLNLVDARHIYVIAKKSIFKKIAKHTQGQDVTLLDENALVEGLSFTDVYRYLTIAGRDNINGVGWYFQQFLKFAFGLSPFCDGYYLTWDSDTLPVSKLHFFQDGQPLFTMKKEYHRPYFDTLVRLLDMDKTSSKSFIAEHMLFNPEFLREMISDIEHSSVKGGNWVEKIVNACDFAGNSICFSEFETYGTYCTIKHPGFYGEQYLNTFRGAAVIQGRKVDENLIVNLARDVDIASFELNDTRFPHNWEKKKYQWKGYIKRLRSVSFTKGGQIILKHLTNKA